MKVMNFMGFTFSTLLALSMSSVVMASCSSEYDEVMNDSEDRGREKSEQLIRYINNKDASGIKAMFSQRNRSEGQNLDAKIEMLIDAFPSGITEYEISPYVGGSSGFDSGSVEFNEESARIFMPRMGLSSGDEDKLIIIEYTHINHNHPNQVGVNMIYYSNNQDGTELQIGSRWSSR